MSWRTVLAHVGAKWQRQHNPLSTPINPLKFFDHGSRTYSIGSCFAMELNRWLRHQGFSVPPVSWGMHYNTRTVLYELQRAVGIPTPNVDWIVRTRDGSVAYVDALRHCVDAKTSEELSRIKRSVSSTSRRAFREANSFLITLGLSDIWEAEVDGERVVLNRAPYRDAVTTQNLSPHSVSNRFMAVEECLGDIREVVRIIREHKSQRVPIVITVSPVPLKHTASGRYHPHIANTRSKATLLAAIFGFLDEDRGDPRVSYFPSYEFFQSNPLGLELWQADDRHPTTEAVSAVAEAFVAAYSDLAIDVKPGFSVPTFGAGPP